MALHSTVILRRALRSVSLRRNAAVLVGLSSCAGSTATALTLCDDGSNNLMDKLVARDKDGNVDWNASFDKAAGQMGKQIQSAIDSGIPTQLSYGFLCGYCSGFALKKAGKVVAVILGVGFMGLQGLSYAGYVHVDHTQLKKDVESALDLNKDGKVDVDDAKEAGNQLMEVFSFGLPGGSGFAAGFVGGIRSG